MKKELRKIIKALQDQGWDIRLTRKSHYRLSSPAGALYFTGSTPSDYHGIKNLRSDLRKMGADL